MTAPGLKARPRDTVPRPEVLFQTPRNLKSSSLIRIECEPDLPPRLCRKDLKDPEQFHQRLVAWLLKQR
jgi:hypothetical protein